MPISLTLHNIEHTDFLRQKESVSIVLPSKKAYSKDKFQNNTYGFDKK